MSSSIADLHKMIEEEEKQFLDFYPQVIHALTKEDYDVPELQQIARHFEKSLKYNVPLGKKRRAMFVVFIYRYYKKTLTEKECEMARVAGWVLELLQGAILVADDIMDMSTTRRGQITWSQTVPTNNHAMNDVYYIEAAVFRAMEIYFKGEDFFIDLMKLVRKMTYITLGGEYLDLTFATPTVVDFTHFTRHTYNRIVKYKTAYYTFYLPAAMAMVMAGIKEQKVYDDALEILLMMGEYFQIQDDYLDCFGDPEVIGKIGTDIQDNKCSWIIVTALENCTAEQRQILQDNYGSWDEAKVKKVKDVYNDIGVEEIYKRYEDDTYKELYRLIKLMDPTKQPIPIYKVFLEKLFKRQK